VHSDCSRALGFFADIGERGDVASDGVRKGKANFGRHLTDSRSRLTIQPVAVLQKVRKRRRHSCHRSEKVSDYALLEATYIINSMLAGREDLRQAIISKKIRVVIMAPTELTTDIPEHSDLTPKDYWDRRARGLRAAKIRPATSCGEENLFCYPGDPYFGESILVHEFCPTIHEIALAEVDPSFDARLKKARAHR
jgi:hypothetical protein